MSNIISTLAIEPTWNSNMAKFLAKHLFDLGEVKDLLARIIIFSYYLKISDKKNRENK